jgi:hypothetical protein
MQRRTLLSSEQRTRLLSIPIDVAAMTRHFLLGAEDLTLIRTKRRATSWSRSRSHGITTRANACLCREASWCRSGIIR